MDQFEKISISHFIWYLVPGLGLIYFLFFPILVFKPHYAILFFKTVGPFGIIILGIISGFFLDGLRLYRFRPKYSTIRDAFFQDLKATIAPKLDPYFIQSHIIDVAKNKNVTGLSLHHAIWIMLGDFTGLAFLEALFWVVASLYLYFFVPCTYSLFNMDFPRDTAIIICVVFVVFFSIICFRFLCISTEDQKTTNTMFLNFAKQHRDEIQKLLNITPSN